MKQALIFLLIYCAAFLFRISPRKNRNRTHFI